jgi:hypothetical protein
MTELDPELRPTRIVVHDPPDGPSVCEAPFDIPETIAHTAAVIASSEIRLANDETSTPSALARRPQVGATNIDDALANSFRMGSSKPGWRYAGMGARTGTDGGALKCTLPQAVTTSLIATESGESLSHTYLRCIFRIVMGVVRETAARGLHCLGIACGGAR